jgi:hypothetical protein
VLSGAPPFYRRLASLAQAALIHRQLSGLPIDYGHFADWAIGNRAEEFYVQSLVDLRSEPRWAPELAAARQIKADFIGRVRIAGHTNEASLVEGELREMLLGSGPNSLTSKCEFPYAFLPGPLEGAEDSPNSLPLEWSQAIQEQLETEDVRATSFIAFVNAAKVFKVEVGHVELATKALRLANHNLARVEAKPQLVGLLNGLAEVAAASRNGALSDEVRILARRYRRSSALTLSVDECFRLCLAAAAARQEPGEWRQYVGEWMAELAFENLTKNDVTTLYSSLSQLLRCCPELWVTCARAEAALQGLLAGSQDEA